MPERERDASGQVTPLELFFDLTIPGAFGDEGVLFAVAYAIVRVLSIVLHISAADDTDVRRAVERVVPSAAVAIGLLVGASLLDGVTRDVLWCAAIAIDYGGASLGGARGWKLHVAHFAERHRHIVIIAFGESIGATGLGAEEIELTAGVVLAAVLGITIAAALWWAYFDVVVLVAEKALREADRRGRAKLARDSYSYIHLLLIAGIVLLAVGARKAIADVDAPLEIVPAAALCGGVALYLIGHVAFRLRNMRVLSTRRLVVAAIAAALIPAATRLSALTTLALLATLTAGLIVYEAFRFSDARARIRSAVRAQGPSSSCF